MRERRSFYRVRVFAHVSLRPVTQADELAERRRLRAQRVEPARLPSFDDPTSSTELRQLLGGVQRIASSLDRIERRLERLERGAERGEELTSSTEISLSASGFAGSFEPILKDGALVVAELDLREAGLPPIRALARVVGPRFPHANATAFWFEEIHPDDRERIVQLAMQVQSQSLRQERSDGEGAWTAPDPESC
jgi:hypothetical protein